MKKIKRSQFLKLTAFLAISSLTACKKSDSSSTQSTTFFRYAENQSENFPTTQAAQFFADLVAEKSNGALQVKIYHSAKLGDETSVIEQVRLGMIDFTRASLGTLSEFYPKLNIVQLPYLYKDADHMWRVLDGEIGDNLRAELAEISIIGLSWFDAGARSFYSVKSPIEKLEDLSGKIIRTQESQLMERMIEALGAVPQFLVFEDVYSALQSGAVDCAENNFPSFESTEHYKIAPYYFLDEHLRVPEIQMMSQAKMEKLSPENAEIIMQAASKSAQYERELWKEREQTSRETVLYAGVTITEFSTQERLRFTEAVAPLYEEFCGEYMDIVEQILNA